MEKNKKFRFEPKGHSYYLGDSKLTGVTTVLDVIAKNNLIQWAADLAAIAGLEAKQITGIEAEYNAIQKIEDWRKKKKAKEELDKKYPLYHEARLAHKRKKEEAGNLGIKIHAEIEKIIKDAITDNLGFIKAENIFNDNVQVKHFVSWAVKNKVKFIASEKRVYSKIYWTAGTYDFKCEIDGKIYISDIKTGGVYDRIPFAQMSAYQMMELENEPNNKIDGRIIINIKKDGKFNSEKDIQFSYDMQTDLDLFLSALKIYRILNNY